jgi:3-hydroxyisobutyrate dehydrogenase
MMRVGFIGLGLMGSGMTNNLQKAGHQLVLHDLRREAAEKLIAGGAEWAGSPRDVAASSDVVFTSLPGPPEFEAVAAGKNGLIEGMQKGQTLFDLSTNSPTVIRRLHKAYADKGAHLLDSPVSGGPGGAASGKMALWVSGDEASYNKYRPVLDAMGDQIFFMGDVGAASVAKLVHNLAGYMVNTALAECFTMGVKAGVDPLLLWKAVRQGANGRRRTFDTLAEHFLPNHYDPARFALKLAHKDVSLATQLGKEVGVPMRLANLTLEEMTEALGRGWQARDSRSSMILQQERSGVKVAVDPDDIRAVLRADSNS